MAEFYPNNISRNIQALSNIRIPPSPVAEHANMALAGTASEFHKRLKILIKDFDQSLDNNSEVGVMLVNFGSPIQLKLTFLGFYNPYLIIMEGEQNGKPVKLIQHVNQISILLIKLQKADPSKPKQKIGFGEGDSSEQENA